MKVLVVNVYYPPVAFGGATIVAEQTTQRLSRMPGVECLVLCLDAIRPRASTDLTRYIWKGVDVVATSAHVQSDWPNYRRERIAATNEAVIRQFAPDVALVHCVQDFGAEIIPSLQRAGVPVALFIHDAWWICERQFMINAGGAYCFQHAVDLDVCRYCVELIEDTRRRDAYLRPIAAAVEARLFPSAFFRDLHLASGLPTEGSIVLRNGVLPPRQPSASRAPEPLASRPVRFGFLGGLGPIKGSDLVKHVFETLPRTDYELVCVDNTMNVGARSGGFNAWRITGAFRLRDSFTQDTIDDFYDEIDVLLFPSQWKESFGLAVREALIRSKWVIVTDGGGTVEDVIDGTNGTIIPLTPDPDPLRQAVLGCFGRDWRAYRNPNAADIHTFESQTHELYTILLQLAERSSAGSAPALAGADSDPMTTPIS